MPRNEHHYNSDINTKLPREGKIERRVFVKTQRFPAYVGSFSSALYKDPGLNKLVKGASEAKCQQQGDTDDQADVTIQTCSVAVKFGHAHAGEEAWGGDGEGDGGWVDVQLQPGTWLPE